MSIDKKALIAQITENVRVPPVQEGSHQEQKPALEQKRPKVSRVKSKPVAPAAAGTSSGRQAAFWLDDEDRAIFREVGMNLYSQGSRRDDINFLIFRLYGPEPALFKKTWTLPDVEMIKQ
jgi:hypothetical protein